MRILLVVTPSFNLATTAAFIDPFRAANYLDGVSRFRWVVASSTGGSCLASNGMTIDTKKLENIQSDPFDIVVVSASWTPETARTPRLLGRSASGPGRAASWVRWIRALSSSPTPVS